MHHELRGACAVLASEEIHERHETCSNDNESNGHAYRRQAFLARLALLLGGQLIEHTQNTALHVLYASL